MKRNIDGIVKLCERFHRYAFEGDFSNFEKSMIDGDLTIDIDDLEKEQKPYAKFIKNIHGWKGDVKLYQCIGGILPPYVVVSAVIAHDHDGPETFIFESDSHGKPTERGLVELEGSYVGGLDHEKALRLAGYETII